MGNENLLAVSVAEAGRRLSVCTRTIFGLIKAGKLPAKKIGRRTVIRVVDLESFLNKSTKAAQ